MFIVYTKNKELKHKNVIQNTFDSIYQSLEQIFMVYSPSLCIYNVLMFANDTNDIAAAPER